MQKAHVQPSLDLLSAGSLHLTCFLDLLSAGSLHLTCFLQAVENHWQPQRWQYCTSQKNSQTNQKVSQHARLSVSSKSAHTRPHARHLCDTAAAGNPEQDPCIDSSDAIMLDNLQDNNIEGRCLHMYAGMCEQPNFKVWSMPTQQQRISNPGALTRVIL